MASVEVLLMLDREQIQDLLYGPSGAVTLEVTRIAQDVVSVAKLLVPVDTGRLRSSITFLVGTIDGRPFAQVGTNVEYAPYVEFGTRYQQAQPYLLPALLRVAETLRG